MKTDKIISTSISYNVISRLVRVIRNVSAILVSGIILLVAICPDLTASASGGQAGAFVSWGAGARSLAMGKAFLAVADDASATYWNPAALVQMDRKEVQGLHAALWADTSYDFLSYVHPTSKWGTLGISYTRLYSDNFAVVEFNWNTLELDVVRTFADVQQAFTLCYGRKVLENLSIGVSSKLITRSLDSSNDFHFSLDTYLFMDKVVKALPLRLGLGIQNLLTAKSGDTDDSMPINFRVGAAYKTLKDKLLVSMDFDSALLKSNINWHMGAEYWVLNFVALRLGFEGDLGTGLRESSAGFGIKYKDYGIDYAFAFHSLGASHRISGNWRFGDSVTASRQEEVKKLLQEGLESVRKGDYALALSRLNSAIDIDPTNREAQTMTTKLQVIVTNVPSLTENTKESEVNRNAINSYIEGDAKTAVNGLRYGFSLNSSDDRILKMLNQFEKETNETQTIPQPKTPNKNEVPRMSLVDQKLYAALEFIYAKQYDKAAMACQEVLSIESNNIIAMERLGSAFFLMKEKDKAKAVWLKVLEIDPNNKTVPKFLEQINRTR